MQWTGPPQRWHEPDPWDAIAIGLHSLSGDRCTCHHCWLAVFDQARAIADDDGRVTPEQRLRAVAERRQRQGPPGPAWHGTDDRRTLNPDQRAASYAAAYASAARGAVHRVFGYADAAT